LHEEHTFAAQPNDAPNNLTYQPKPYTNDYQANYSTEPDGTFHNPGVTYQYSELSHVPS